MGLFESEYRRNVLTEIERKLRELEKMKSVNIDEKLSQLQAVVDFLGQGKLLKDMEFAMFQKRLEQIKRDKEHERFKSENYEIADDYTNPIEMSKKFQSIEQAEAEISLLKSKTESKVNDTSTSVCSHSLENDFEERSY